MRASDAVALFGRNAGSYDRVNRIISLGLDRRWRRWVAEKAVISPGSRVLDVMSGAGEVAVLAAALGAEVTAVDVSPEMLAATPPTAHLRTMLADVNRPDQVPDAPFDAVTMSFGLRYLDDPVRVLSRLGDRLGPRGSLVLLEFCVPRPGPVATPASLYFFHLLPRIASALAGSRDLYRVLSVSTKRIGSAENIIAMVRSAGFRVVEHRSFGFGLVVGLVCEKSGASHSRTDAGAHDTAQE